MNRERILAHRGCWKEECEEHKRNSFYSWSSALKAGVSTFRTNKPLVEEE